jgi:hypothetical protein
MGIAMLMGFMDFKRERMLDLLVDFQSRAKIRAEVYLGSWQ